MRKPAKHPFTPLCGGCNIEIIHETEKTESLFKISFKLHGMIKRGSFPLTKG